MFTSVATELIESEAAQNRIKSQEVPSLNTHGVLVRNSSQLTGHLHTQVCYSIGSVRQVTHLIQHGRV